MGYASIHNLAILRVLLTAVERAKIWLLELATVQKVMQHIVAAPFYFHFSHLARFSTYFLRGAWLTFSEKSSAYILRYSRLIFCVALGLHFA